MAGQFSVYTANRVLAKVLRGEDFSVTSSLWIALFRATDGTALRANVVGTALEVTAAGYARAEIRGSTGLTMIAPVEGATQVSGVVPWAQAIAPWGTVTFAALMDAATGGNVIVYGALASPKAVDTADVFKIPAGLFTVSL